MGTLPRRPPETIPSGPLLRAGVKSMPYSVMGKQHDAMPMGAGPSPSRALQAGNRGCFMLINCEVTIKHRRASSLRASGATALPKSPNVTNYNTAPSGFPMRRAVLECLLWWRSFYTRSSFCLKATHVGSFLSVNSLILIRLKKEADYFK